MMMNNTSTRSPGGLSSSGVANFDWGIDIGDGDKLDIEDLLDSAEAFGSSGGNISSSNAGGSNPCLQHLNSDLNLQMQQQQQPQILMQQHYEQLMQQNQIREDFDSVDDDSKRFSPTLDAMKQPEDPSPSATPTTAQSVLLKKRKLATTTVVDTGPSRRAGKKKPKGMPKRPLSAYNIFFQRERLRIYEEFGASGDRVTFEELGKEIGHRWRSLSEKDRKEYDDIAEKEVERYRQEMDAYEERRRKRLDGSLSSSSKNNLLNNNKNGLHEPTSLLQNSQIGAFRNPGTPIASARRVELLPGLQARVVELPRYSNPNTPTFQSAFTQPSPMGVVGREQLQPSSSFHEQPNQVYYVSAPAAAAPPPSPAASVYHHETNQTYYMRAAPPSPAQAGQLHQQAPVGCMPPPSSPPAAMLQQHNHPRITSSLQQQQQLVVARPPHHDFSGVASPHENNIVMRESTLNPSAFPIPPGMQVVLPDETGRNVTYTVSYTCYQMSKSDAHRYIKSLESQPMAVADQQQQQPQSILQGAFYPPYPTTREL